MTRRQKVFTTRADPDAVRAPDLVNRNFTATGPNELWVTEPTHVPTRSAMAYACFIIDAFSRRIVGWPVAAHMQTTMVLDAVEMARRSRGSRRLVGLVTHSDDPLNLSSSPHYGSPNDGMRSALGPPSVRWPIFVRQPPGRAGREAAIHEKAIEPIRDGLAIDSGPFYYAWVIPGALVDILLAVGFSGFLRRLPADTRTRYLAAGALFVFGAIGFEALAASYVLGGTEVVAPDVRAGKRRYEAGA